jgi:uncharacterized protein with NAD-binding domain and iron-sulfur cluster
MSAGIKKFALLAVIACIVATTSCSTITKGASAENIKTKEKTSITETEKITVKEKSLQPAETINKESHEVITTSSETKIEVITAEKTPRPTEPIETMQDKLCETTPISLKTEIEETPTIQATKEKENKAEKNIPKIIFSGNRDCGKVALTIDDGWSLKWIR